MKTGIIGYGSMGKMLLWKFSESGINREDLFVSNRTIAKAEEANNTINQYSQQGRRFQRQQEKLSEQAKWDKLVAEKQDIDKHGGLGSFWDNVEKFGFTNAFMNWRKANEFRTNHVDAKTFDEAKEKMDADRRRQKDRQMAATLFH